MRVEITFRGRLNIYAESDLEGFALMAWYRENVKTMTDTKEGDPITSRDMIPIDNMIFHGDPADGTVIVHGGQDA